MTSIVGTMTTEGNEIMLLPIGVFCVGAAIGLASRIIGRQFQGGRGPLKNYRKDVYVYYKYIKLFY